MRTAKQKSGDKSAIIFVLGKISGDGLSNE
jgi:hypothetical protein